MSVYLFQIEPVFLVLGVFLGVRVFRTTAPIPFDCKPKAHVAVVLSERELEVPHELTAD